MSIPPLALSKKFYLGKIALLCTRGRGRIKGKSMNPTATNNKSTTTTIFVVIGLAAVISSLIIIPSSLAYGYYDHNSKYLTPEFKEVIIKDTDEYDLYWTWVYFNNYCDDPHYKQHPQYTPRYQWLARDDPEFQHKLCDMTYFIEDRYTNMTGHSPAAGKGHPDNQLYEYDDKIVRKFGVQEDLERNIR
jgi:hypothetical protein